MGMDKIIREEARLIILRALAEEPVGRISPAAGGSRGVDWPTDPIITE